MDLTTTNVPDVVDEVRAAFEAYERALVANDIDLLDRAFWTSESTVRFGVDGTQHGTAAIDAARRSRPGVPPGRRLGPTVIATFGADVACVSTEVRNDGSSAVGRQSQTWVRLAGRWQIVAAHVSHQQP